jgi:small subunit ribosomal protein S20
MVARAVSALQANQSEDVESAVATAVKALDKAATKGIIHRNNAARKKSRLMAKLNAIKTS